MTRSQVRYVLGTPMVSDPFEPDRWDYVYTLQKGHDKRIDRAHFVVLFEADKVVKVDKLDLPEESDVAKRVRAERDKRAAAEAKAAPILRHACRARRRPDRRRPRRSRPRHPTPSPLPPHRLAAVDASRSAAPAQPQPWPCVLSGCALPLPGPSSCPARQACASLRVDPP